MTFGISLMLSHSHSLTPPYLMQCSYPNWIVPVSGLKKLATRVECHLTAKCWASVGMMEDKKLAVGHSSGKQYDGTQQVTWNKVPRGTLSSCCSKLWCPNFLIFRIKRSKWKWTSSPVRGYHGWAGIESGSRAEGTACWLACVELLAPQNEWMADMTVEP